MNFYRQCILVRQETQQVAWIPEQFAAVGKYLKIEDEDGWKVTSVHSRRQSEDYILAHERDHMGHRSRTDI